MAIAESGFTIAICADDYTAPGKPPRYDAASGRWKTYLEEAGCLVKWVDVRSPAILSEVEDCDGFMWRWAHFAGMGRIARRLLPILERDLGLAVYPDQSTCWHYDDKVAQALLFEALGIPSPRSWIFYDRDLACAWVMEQKFPLVMKLASGAGSENVILVDDHKQAESLINKSFEYYDYSLRLVPSVGLRRRASIFVRNVLQGRPILQRDTGYEPQTGYVLFQEFLPNNAYDTRITVVGRRAFGFRRWNRPQDFRASGSGRVDYDFVRLAFATARRLGMQSCAIDGLWRGEQPVVAEVSYTYVSGNVHDCSGHWELDGDPQSGALRWIDGHMWPERAQVDDFLVRLRARRAPNPA